MRGVGEAALLQIERLYVVAAVDVCEHVGWAGQDHGVLFEEQLFSLNEC